MASHAIWVGSWWAYTRDGIAYRHKLRGGFPECTGVTAEQAPQAVVDAGKAFCLSAAEKVDYLAGRLGNIEWDKIAEYQRITQNDLGSLQERIRELVRLLNKWIGENPGQDWRETDNGREYLAKKMELETAQANLPALTIDTATEFERINHGNGVPGVGSWWGHCNAWSAAALMEDEPKVRGAVTNNGVSVEFTPGEAKALLTEIWMEHQSSFHGARHEDPENTGLHYDDLTPAAFHVFFGTQLGQKKKGFVIDRFTGSEVWNQPVRSYVSRYEKLYQGDAAEKIELFQTTYNRSTGEPEKRSLGERDVYPVQYTTTFHWVTDGLPHEAVTVDNILAPEAHGQRSPAQPVEQPGRDADADLHPLPRQARRGRHRPSRRRRRVGWRGARLEPRLARLRLAAAGPDALAARLREPPRQPRRHRARQDRPRDRRSRAGGRRQCRADGRGHPAGHPRQRAHRRHQHAGERRAGHHPRRRGHGRHHPHLPGRSEGHPR
ncbi:MAG: hypothetical protein R3F43_31230 [bacterium]